MEIATGEGQIQIHLISKQEQYAIPDTPLSIGANIRTDELNTLVNTILQESGDFLKPIEFDFLIAGEFVRSRLGDHLRERSVSFEDTIHIEYVERFPAPEPQDCLLHDDWVSAVATRDQYILTGCYDNTVNIWTTKGVHTLTLPGHEAPVKSVTWVSLDARTGIFASSSQDQTAMLWSWDVVQNTARCLFVCRGHERGVDAIRANPAGLLLATGSWDTMLKVWTASARLEENDEQAPGGGKRPKTAEEKVQAAGVVAAARTRTPMMTLQGHREAISAVEWMADDMVLTSSWDHTLKIWDLSLEGVKAEISGNKSFFDASYSKLNGLIVTASADKNVRMFDARTNQGTIVKNTYLGHSAWVQSVAWSKTEEHLFISGSYDHQVKLWDMRSPKAPLYDLVGHEDKVHAVDWTNPKYMVSGGSDNTVRVFKSRKAFQTKA